MANAKVTIGQLIKSDRSNLMYIALTTEQMQAAGKAVMADARCTSDVKAAVRRAIGGKPGAHTYITSDVHTWYDSIFVAHGVQK